MSGGGEEREGRGIEEKRGGVGAEVSTNGGKNINWIDTDNRWTLKNIDVLQKEKNLKPMSNTIDQNWKFVYLWVDTFGGQHDL